MTSPYQFLLDWGIGLVVFGTDCHRSLFYWRLTTTATLKKPTDFPKITEYQSGIKTAVVKRIDRIGRCTGNFNYHMIIALVASIYGRKNHISFSFCIDINFSLVNYGLICFVLSLIFILMN